MSPAMDTPNWFHVFDADSKLWLQDDELSWGGYFSAAEFLNLDLARAIAQRVIAQQPDITKSMVIVLGDFGQVES